MNFGTDTDQIKALARELEGYSGQVETIIKNIYSKLEGLNGNNGNGWEGKGYDAFLADCKAYESALMQIPEVMKSFATFFEGKVTSSAETLHTSVQNAYREIEGA